MNKHQPQLGTPVMNHCSSPPQLTDDQLSAVLDGQPDPSVSTHLARCAWCAGRLDRARHIEQRLAAALQRWDCPPPDRLRDYHLACLSPSEASAIAAHLSQCPHCSTELAILSDFLESTATPAVRPVYLPPRPPGPRWRVGELVAQVAPRPPGLATRRAAPREPLIAEAAGNTLMIDTEDSDGSLALIGHLVASEPERWLGALVELRRDNRLLATALLDEGGGFRCAAIAPGPVSMRISAPDGVAIVVAELPLSA